jgi:hypothetical protein
MQLLKTKTTRHGYVGMAHKWARQEQETELGS